MKRLAALAGLILLLSHNALAQDERVLDEIVAIVDDKVVLRSEVDAVLYNVMQQNQLGYSDELWQDVLQQNIDQKVLAAHAKLDTNLVVTDDEVDQAITRRLDQMVAQIGSEDQLVALYGKSMIEIRADLRTNYREQLLAEKFQGQKLQTIRITPSEVASFFATLPIDSIPPVPETVRMAHIVRYPDITDAARAEAQEVLQAIRDSVTAGAEFELYAEVFSEDPGSAERGGRYTNSKLSELVPEFAAVAARSPIGEISPIFESPFGLHILRVNDRRGEVLDYNHILIGFDRTKADPTGAIELLSTLRDSIVNDNAPFERLASEYSEDQLSKGQGGRVLDPQTGSRDIVASALGPTWRNTLSDLEVGSWSEPAPVELLNGDRAYHILLLQQRVPEHRVDLETDYEQIEQYALQEKRARVMEAWINELKRTIYVRILAEAANPFNR